MVSRSQVCIDRNTTHGMSKRSEYSNWKDMKKRCFNKNNKRYVDYAERGISVHEDFINDFPAWLKEIGDKPNSDVVWSVGRIDNDDWYTYGNMRWETLKQQAQNHTRQRNNTSGIQGVNFNEKVISGTSYFSWVATWADQNGKSRTKQFSTNKYGHDEAKRLAIEYRSKMICSLNVMGAEYAESHGTAK